MFGLAHVMVGYPAGEGGEGGGGCNSHNIKRLLLILQLLLEPLKLLLFILHTAE
jgi:hypothetical protein